MNNFRVELGKWGEEQAERFLISKGVKIQAKNIRTEFGEIDLLGVEDDCLLFIEVKTSKTRKFGFPEISVTDKKMEHMQKSALRYLQEHVELDNDWRIDVVAVEVKNKNRPEIKWFKNVIS